MKAHTFRPRGPWQQEAIDGDFRKNKYSRDSNPTAILAWDSRVVWRRGVRSLPGIVCETFARRRCLDARGILSVATTEKIFSLQPLLLAASSRQPLDLNHLVFQPIPR